MAVRRDHRRRLALLTAALFALLLCPFFPALAADYDPAHPENLTTEHLNAQACILIEKDSGDVIFEKNADAMMYPASTTKIMTAYLALTMADVSETTVCSPTALAVPEDSSSARLVAGEQVNLLDLVYVTMLKSANDGANVIAEAVSGSIPAFVELMNQAADVLGCTGTHFANAHGYHDENHYTTARDMAVIARAALKNETLRQIVNTKSYTMPKDNMRDAREYANTNKFINYSESSENCYYQWGNGVKTGHHSAAGYCLVSSATKDGVSLIAVVFGASSETASYTDSIKLMDYGFTQYVSTSIAEIYAMNPKVVDISGFSLDDENVGKLELALQKTDEITPDLVVTTQTGLEYWLQNFNDLTVTEYTRAFSAPITQGEVMGTLTYYPESGSPVVYNLIATRSVVAREALAPTLNEIIEAAENDPNPFPRFTFELFLLYIALPLFLLYLLLRALGVFRKTLKKHHKVRVVKPKNRYYQ